MVVGDASLNIDTLVIGAGPGGYVVAIRAASTGPKRIDRRQIRTGRCLFEPWMYSIQSPDLCRTPI